MTYEVPKMKVAALRFIETADQLALRDPLGQNTITEIMFEGDKS